jgi:pyridoxine 5-phosphate synthase
MTSESTIRLGVNVDHVATLRQARGTLYPDPVDAARVAAAAGADGITVHLREDRRHIQEHDVERLTGMPGIRVNLELALAEPVLRVAERLRPAECCLVPERRAELTTEGGLDVAADPGRIRAACERLAALGVRVAPFVDPDPVQIEACARAGVRALELHTGRYADAAGGARAAELERLREAARRASRLGIEVHAGHGLNYRNVQPVAALPEVVELNIGHAIVAQALFDGMARAVADMKELMLAARR